MKIRTKLVLVLCVALVVTTVVSSWVQIRWTRQNLEARTREQLTAAAATTAEDLESHLPPDFDADDITDRLNYAMRRHHVANMELSFDSDEDTTVSVNLGSIDEEAKVKSTARPARHRPAVRRDEIRRAVGEHGESSRPPGERVIDPLWRTPDRPESPGWERLARQAPTARQSSSRQAPRGPVVVDLRDAQQKQARFLEVTTQVQLPGMRRGQLIARLSLDAVDRAVIDAVRVSVGVTGAALLVLVLLTGFIANRALVRPLEALLGAMRGVEGGDLRRRVDDSGRDEIAGLNRGFNAMIERLGAADGEIRAFNRRLADEVQNATIDLARKNEALGHLNRLLVDTRRELGDKERLAALGQLAAQLAHEIGTPLASVSGHLQLATSGRDTPPPLRERLLKANRELERVSRIVRDYLDSTRPIKPARVDCDLDRLLDDAVGIALGSGERPGLSIERRIATSAAHISTDPSLLRQILINLFTNAIDAVGTRAGRERGGSIVFSAEAEAGAVALRVKDDGVGIAAEDAARILEPFYTTKGRGKGTGLGLAICRELATALGGRLSVESVPGEGSTFTLRLPAGVDLSLAPNPSMPHSLRS